MYNISLRIHDPNEVAAIELQVKEFGQTPRQLFTHPHPLRLVERPSQASPQGETPEMKTAGDTTKGLGSVETDPVDPCDPCDPGDDWVNVEMPSGGESTLQGGCMLTGQRTLTLKTKEKLHKE